MKKLLYLVILTITLTMCCTSCTIATCDAGEECVFVKKPWFFGKGGVSKEALDQGTEWCALSTEPVYVNMKPVKINEPLEDVSSNNSTLLDFNCHITLQVEVGKSPMLVEKFGKGWYENSLQEPYRVITRNYISRESPFDLMSNREVLEKIDSCIMKDMNKLIVERGVPVKIISVYTGKATPNAPQLEEMNRTAAQIQAKETQDRRFEMEVSRQRAEEQRAESDKAYQKTMGLTADQFVQLKAWDIIKDKPDANIDVLFNAEGTDKMWNVRRN